MRWTWKQLHWPQPLEHTAILGLLQRLAADEQRGPLVFEARAEAGQIVHLIGSTATNLSATLSTLRRIVPDVATTDLSTPRSDVERAGRVRIRQRHLGLSLDTSGAALRSLLAALSSATGQGDVLVLQVILGTSVPPQPVEPRPQDPNLTIFDLIVSGPRPASSELRADMRAKLSQYRFRATIRLGVSSPSPVRRRMLVFGVLAGLRQLQTGSTRIELQTERPELVNDAVIPARKPLRLTPDEALSLLVWPIGDRDLPGMPPAHPRLQAPPGSYQAPSRRIFATASAPGSDDPVGISIQDALRHTHIVGPSGVGKSTVLLNLIAADIQDGRSVVVIDPKRDLATDVLSIIPEERAGDVVVLDPTLPNPVGLNPLAEVGDQGPLVADSILTIFKNLFPSAFGPRTSDAIHASLLTLARRDGSTLADLPRLLTDERFRREYTADIDDATLAGFWAQYNAMKPANQAATIGPILTRLRQFLLRPGVRAVLDQAAPRFALGDLFTKPRIFIVTLNKGLVGPQAAALLGSLVVSQLWHLILGRAAVPKGKRTPVSIFLDEAQTFLHLDTDLGEALEQSRSMGAAWHLAHQHRGQMPTSLLAGISANTRNKIQFAADPIDAQVVARHSRLEPQDIIKLGPFEAYVDVLNNGTQTGWFSARTLPPPTALSNPDLILAESQARYGQLEQPDDLPDATGPRIPAVVLEALEVDGDEPVGRVRKAAS